MTGLTFLSSRRNEIAIKPGRPPGRSVARFRHDFGNFSDVQCQANNRCRGLSRNFPTLVNESDFDAEITRGVRAVFAARAALGTAAHCDGPSPPRPLRRRQRRRGGRRRDGGRGWSGVAANSVRRAMQCSAWAWPAAAAAARGGRGAGAAGRAARRGGCGRRRRRRPTATAAARGSPSASSNSRASRSTRVVSCSRRRRGGRRRRLDVFLALEEGSFLYSNLDFGAILAQQRVVWAAADDAGGGGGPAEAVAAGRVVYQPYDAGDRSGAVAALPQGPADGGASDAAAAPPLPVCTHAHLRAAHRGRRSGEWAALRSDPQDERQHRRRLARRPRRAAARALGAQSALEAVRRVGRVQRQGDVHPAPLHGRRAAGARRTSSSSPTRAAASPTRNGSSARCSTATA